MTWAAAVALVLFTTANVGADTDPGPPPTSVPAGSPDAIIRCKGGSIDAGGGVALPNDKGVEIDVPSPTASAEPSAGPGGVTLAVQKAQPEAEPLSDEAMPVDGSGPSVEEVPSGLRPPPDVGMQGQVPARPRGAPLTAEARRKTAEKAAERGDFGWFPSTPPNLPPYLATLDEFGNTAVAPGALLDRDPLSTAAQQLTSAVSGLGLRYTFLQSYTLTSMSNVAQGDSTLQYYTATFVGKWGIYDARKLGMAGWLSTEVDVQLGLTPHSRTQSPQGNLGSITLPVATVFGPNGAWVAELAWQQSLMNGALVVLAGLIDQSNYIDENAYANYSQGQLMNSALVNSMVLPLPYNNLGLNIQWQSDDSWYLLFGTGANNQPPGGNAFEDLGFDNWSYLLELGFTPEDVFGLGRGTYRIQPFTATVSGRTQAGLCFNIDQRLGTNSPFAYFGRFGFGGSAVTIDGAKAQLGTGLAVQAPLKNLGLVPALSNDYFATAFFWSQPSQPFGPAFHDNETGLETTYVLQLTPTATVQPDVQVIWNRAGNPDGRAAAILQLQINLSW